MNKYQEAKEILEKYDYSTKLELSEGIRNNITSGITVEQFFMMKETCIELLDKATPKKHIVEYCPTCGESVCLLVVELHKDDRTLFYEVSHCCNCGQAIDWSEDE